MSEIDVSIKSKKWNQVCANAEQLSLCAANAVLNDIAGRARGTPANNEVSIVLADDAMVRTLNSDYRGINKPTNVLSFSAENETGAPTPPIAAPRLLGDVVLACETISAEASAGGITIADHLSHLVVHGVLHLLGFDHETDAEAAQMEARETEILARLGIACPYTRGRKTDGG